MRKNRTKHEAKKPRLAKRALALCFALIFVCSCLLPVFAHSEVGTLADSLTMAEQPASSEQPTEPEQQQEEQKQEEANASKETQEEPASSSTANNEASGESQSTASSDSASSEGSASSAPGESASSSSASTAPGEPASSSSASSEASGEPEQPASSETKTEQPASSETKPEEPKQPTTNTTGDTIEQGKATYTYRFWPDKIDAFDLEAINDDVKSGTSLNDAAQSRVKMVPCTVLTVMTNANLRDYQANVQQPTKSGYEFAGWYTVDGTTEDKFSFEQSLNFEESKTIDVFAKWEKVESTVEDEMEKTEPTTEDKLDKTESGTESGKANESKEETLLPVEKTGAVGLANNEGDTVSIAVKAENLPGKVNELVVTDLNEDEEGAAFGNALAASSYKDWTVTNLMVNITPKDAEGKTVEPNEAVTVHFSGLESLMIQYSSEMDLKVLHMKRDGTLEALSLKNIQTKETQEGTVLSSFAVSTTSFSPFVLAASESASIEPTELYLDEYNYGKTLTVGESIVVKSNRKRDNFKWTVSDGSALDIISEGEVNNVPYARVKALRTTNSVTIRYGGTKKLGSSTYEFKIVSSRNDEEWSADIFFLKTPKSTKESNSSDEWLPNGIDPDGNNTDSNKGVGTNWSVSGYAINGTINTSGARWDDKNKNIFLTDINNLDGSFVKEWPDNSKNSAWTLYNDDVYKTAPEEYDGAADKWSFNNKVFDNVLAMIWSNYQSYLKTELDIANLTEADKSKITQITLTPYKIAREKTMHIDCTIGVTGMSYVANFWVKAPGDTEYHQAYGKSYAQNAVVNVPTDGELLSWKNTHNGQVELNTDGTLKETIEKNGVTYKLQKWYKEDSTNNAKPSTEKAEFPHYSPSATELSDGIVNFYACYVPQDTALDKDDPYIIVEKEVKGIDKSKLPTDFCITVGGTQYDLSSRVGNIITTDDGFKIRWKINVGAGNHTVGEDHYTVNGYKVDVEVNGKPVTNPSTGVSTSVDVTAKAFTMTPKIITKNSVNTFDFGVSGGLNHIFAISITGKGSNKKRNIIISKEPLSVLERASVEKTLEELQTGPGSSFANNGQNEFYSLKDQRQIVVDHGIITYDDGNKQVTISNTSEWNKVMGLSYSVEDGNNPEVSITNTYTLNTTNVTIAKKTTGAFADRAKAFKFTVSGLNEDATLEGTNVTGNYGFTLSNGESVTIKNLKVGQTITITEDATDSKDYDTTDTCHTEKAKSFKYKVCFDETSGKIYLQALDASGNAIDGKKITGENLSITVTNNFDGNPDTGVLLDTLPYLILLAVAVAGGVLVVVRKRKHRDE